MRYPQKTNIYWAGSSTPEIIMILFTRPVLLNYYTKNLVWKNSLSTDRIPWVFPEFSRVETFPEFSLFSLFSRVVATLYQWDVKLQPLTLYLTTIAFVIMHIQLWCACLLFCTLFLFVCSIKFTAGGAFARRRCFLCCWHVEKVCGKS